MLLNLAPLSEKTSPQLFCGVAPFGLTKLVKHACGAIIMRWNMEWLWHPCINLHIYGSYMLLRLTGLISFAPTIVHFLFFWLHENKNRNMDFLNYCILSAKFLFLFKFSRNFPSPSFAFFRVSSSSTLRRRGQPLCWVLSFMTFIVSF